MRMRLEEPRAPPSTLAPALGPVGFFVIERAAVNDDSFVSTPVFLSKWSRPRSDAAPRVRSMAALAALALVLLLLLLLGMGRVDDMRDAVVEGRVPVPVDGLVERREAVLVVAIRGAIWGWLVN